MKPFNRRGIWLGVALLVACGAGFTTLPKTLRGSVFTTRNVGENFVWVTNQDGGIATITESLADLTAVPTAFANPRTMVFTAARGGGWLLAAQTTLVSKGICAGTWADVSVKTGSLTVNDRVADQFEVSLEGEVSCDGGAPTSFFRRGAMVAEQP